MNDATGPRRAGLAYFLVRLWREKPLGTAGGVVVLGLILVAIFADVLAPYPFDEVNLMALLQPPSAEHLMGTDQLGQPPVLDPQRRRDLPRWQW